MIKLLRFLNPYRPVLFLILLLAIAQTAANLYLPNLMSDIVNKGISRFDTNFIRKTGIVMVIVAIGGTICTVIGVFFASQVATGMSQTLRSELFRKVQLFSLHEFDSISTASLITRTTNDTTQVQQLMVMTLSLLITAPITLIVGTILALDQDVGLAWILLAIMPVLVGVIVIAATKAIPLFMVMQKKLDKLNLILDENLTGVRVIRAFDRIQHEEERFDQANREVTDVAIRVNQLLAVLMPIMMLMISISQVAIVWFGSERVGHGTLQMGAMFAFMQYAMQILFSLLMVALLFIMVPRAEASAARISEVLEMQPEITDPREAKPATRLHGTVEFHDVTFSYHGAESPALSDITFCAHPGEVTAIIGGTGAGKSTLVNLIPRFYDVAGGRILVDGVETREMSQECLRAKIGFVPQKAVLFSGTINDNLRFGKEDASDEEVRHAAEVAQATEFIAKMPDGFDSLIAQGGTNVSGGQMQRLSIARALVRQPEIYVFDDTFSALDFKTDAKLRSALKGETRDATVLIVAQRVSTVMDADQIIVLDEGRMAGIGTHRELMKTCPVYSGIVSSQLSAAEIAGQAS
jgi:ATP-binding cassette, subfamily B, multidrug efflux pump